MLFEKKQKSEDVLKRKSYYGFAKKYPGPAGTSKYVIGESRTVKKKETARRILIAAILLFLFLLSYFITTICLDVSEKPIDAKKTVCTFVQAEFFVFYWEK